ncbi:MAG: hypothetical protein ACFWTJ_09085 [Lachnoclostridium sp.]|jgi:ABC-2 type transport system ATP-binding protein
MITIHNLSKEYVTKKQTVKALNNINLNIEKGESLAILGLNGSGKSTLVHSITGIISPTQGEVLINHLRPKDGKAYRKQFSVVYQNSGLDYYLTVYDNLKTNGFMYGLRGKGLKAAIDEVIDIMDLHKYKKCKISELSGGYAKRVQVAKTLMLDTPIIIMDEPTHGMDPLIKKRLFEILNQKNQEGKIIIYTTQILDEVEKICNRVIILQDGYMISNDTIQNTKHKFSRNNVLEILLTDTDKNMNLTESKLKEVISKYNLSLYSLEFHFPTIKVVSQSSPDLLLQLASELRTWIDIGELNIKQASLEEILINMKEGINL